MRVNSPRLRDAAGRTAELGQVAFGLEIGQPLAAVAAEVAARSPDCSLSTW